MFNADEFEAKTRIFSERALDQWRDEGERAFWAAAALELLAKTVLVRHSPTLIADPADSRFGEVLLAAAGVTDASGSARTIPAKALWARTERAFKSFRKSDAEKISSARNEYIHGSGDIFFAGIPAEIWWRRFWSIFSLVAESGSRTLADLLPEEHIGDVEAKIESERGAVKLQVQSRMEAAEVRRRLIESGSLSHSARREHERITSRASAHAYQSKHNCPVCGLEGTLSGDDVLETRVDYGSSAAEGYDDEFWEEPVGIHKVASEQFFCPNCVLLLDRWTQLPHADIEDVFEVIDANYVVDWDGDYQNE